MVKISLDLANILSKENWLGNFSEYGACIGDNEFVLVYGEGDDDGIYLAHISEFEQDGIFIRLKKNK